MSQKPAEVIVRNRGTARRPSASHGRRSALVIVAVALASAAALAAWLSSPRLVGLAGAEPPRLEVDRQVIDFGDVPFERWVTATFTLRNTGRGPLRIADAPKVRALEGCWPPPAVVGRTTLGPGESTQLELRFTMHRGMGGPHDFRVALVTNDPVTPTQELTVRSRWGQWPTRER